MPASLMPCLSDVCPSILSPACDGSRMSDTTIKHIKLQLLYLEDVEVSTVSQLYEAMLHTLCSYNYLHRYSRWGVIMQLRLKCCWWEIVKAS